MTDDTWFCDRCEEDKPEDEPCHEWRGGYICQSCMEALSDQAYEGMKNGE